MFADYIFLQKGKGDRRKVLDRAFLMWGTPRFLPYALWFNPDLLPPTFKNAAANAETTLETTAQRFAREQTVSILSTLANLERQAKTQAAGCFFSSLNLFGGSAKKNKQTLLVAVYNHTKSFLINNNNLQNDDSMQPLRSLVNKGELVTRAEQKLVGVPALHCQRLESSCIRKAGEWNPQCSDSQLFGARFFCEPFAQTI